MLLTNQNTSKKHHFENLPEDIEHVFEKYFPDRIVPLS